MSYVVIECRTHGGQEVNRWSARNGEPMLASQAQSLVRELKRDRPWLRTHDARTYLKTENVGGAS